jgi:hypothetical protein
MKQTFLLLITVGTGATMLCSCGGMRPNDNLQQVVSGDIFNPKPYDPKEEKRLDEAAWNDHLIYPPGYSVDPENQHDYNQGAVAFQVPVQ